MIFLQAGQTGKRQFIKFFLCYIVLNVSLFGCSHYSSDSLKSFGTLTETDSAEIDPQVEYVQNSVWLIHNKSRSNMGEFTLKETLFGGIKPPTFGTAFSIKPNLFVTNFHVLFSILDQGSISDIALQQKGNSSSLTINRVLQISALYDLVLFETKENVTSYLSIKEDRPQPDEELFILGYPGGKFKRMEKTGTVIDEGLYYAFPVNHFSLHGASGGPVLNAKEQVVGITFLGFENMSKAVKSKHLNELIKGNRGLNCSHFPDLVACIEKELENLNHFAERGNAHAQYVTGSMYFNKPGVTESELKLAFDWYQKSASQGHTVAQINLANMYYWGRGTKQDKEEALYWTMKVAAQGEVSAQGRLALLYYEDKEIKQDMKKAFYWAKESAAHGGAMAQSLLGLLYYKKGIEKQDPKLLQLATDWFTKSANQGHPIGQYSLAKIILMRERSKVTKNFQLASGWMHKSAKGDYAHAQYELAIMYDRGEVPDIDPKYQNVLSSFWMQKSAERNNAQAQYNLAIGYVHSYINAKKKKEVNWDLALAFFWMSRSANLNYRNAQHDLATMYLNKKERTQEDVQLAFNLMEKSAKQKYSSAQYFLANWYKDKDEHKSLYWLQEAAKQGHVIALYELGLEFRKKKNFRIADHLIKESANRGHLPAQKLLE